MKKISIAVAVAMIGMGSLAMASGNPNNGNNGNDKPNGNAGGGGAGGNGGNNTTEVLNAQGQLQGQQQSLNVYNSIFGEGGEGDEFPLFATESAGGQGGLGGLGGQGGEGGIATSTSTGGSSTSTSDSTGGTSISDATGGESNSDANSGSNSSNSLTINEAAIPADTSVTYRGSYKIKNTPDASAPSLTSSNGTCMGSSSIGGSGPGIGVSLGTTWTDDGCTHRYNAEMMYNLGHKEVAVKIMCREESVAESAPVLCPKKVEDVNKTEVYTYE